MVTNPSSLLRLLFQCDSVEFHHLPVAGGLYDQHPDFLDGLAMLREIRGNHEEKKRKEDEAKQKREMGSQKGRRRR